MFYDRRNSRPVMLPVIKIYYQLSTVCVGLLLCLTSLLCMDESVHCGVKEWCYIVIFIHLAIEGDFNSTTDESCFENFKPFDTVEMRVGVKRQVSEYGG